MAKTQKVLNEEIKLRFLENIVEHLTNCGEEVVRTASNEIAIPTVDAEGNDKWVVIPIKVPTGSRDGDAYDGYSVAEDYAMKLQEKAEKQAAKDAKAAADEAKRAKSKSKEKAEG